MARRNVLSAPKQNFGKLILQKKNFLISVYLLLAIQVAITAYTIHHMRKNETLYNKVRKYFWAWFIASLVLVVILAMVPMPIWMKLVIFSGLSVILGMNSIAASTKIPVEVIKTALYGALSIFTFMTVLGFVLAAMGVNLQFLSFILLIALFCLVIGLLLTHFMKVSSKIHKALLIFGIVLFGIFVGYDTNLMLQPGYAEDIVSAAFNLYLDILNLFSQMIGLESLD